MPGHICLWIVEVLQEYLFRCCWWWCFLVAFFPSQGLSSVTLCLSDFGQRQGAHFWRIRVFLKKKILNPIRLRSATFQDSSDWRRHFVSLRILRKHTPSSDRYQHLVLRVGHSENYLSADLEKPQSVSTHSWSSVNLIAGWGSSSTSPLPALFHVYCTQNHWDKLFSQL